MFEDETVVGGGSTEASIDGEARLSHEQTAELFRVLGVPSRLMLLSLLRTPKPVKELHVRPVSYRAGTSPDRPISRPALERHLQRLLAAGIVRSRVVRRKGGRPMQGFVVDHSRLFALAEEIRRLSAFAATNSLEPGETVGAPSAPYARWDPGPKLLLAHGAPDGSVFHLRQTEVRGDRGWIIGRKASAHVRLEYDPFVSGENSEVVRGPVAFRLIDLRTSKNGTFLNWERLPPGGQAPLQHGDIIGVGRSLLVFWAQ